MDDVKIIEVKQSVFADNDADAKLLREQLREEKTFLLNLMSSPGAGVSQVADWMLKHVIEWKNRS